jgi:hypothetical protein
MKKLGLNTMRKLGVNTNIYWKSCNPYVFKEITTYFPYVTIKGYEYEIFQARITKAGVTSTKYSLWFGGELYFEGTLSAAMVKGTELIQDLNFIGYGDTLQPEPTLCKIDHPIIGWKQALYDAVLRPAIVKIRIPEGTYCNLTDYKCRAQTAEVIGVYEFQYAYGLTSSKWDLIPLDNEVSIYSIYRNENLHQSDPHRLDHWNYHVGDTLTVDNFLFNNDECAPGIHFFRSPIAALKYRMW